MSRGHFQRLARLVNKRAGDHWAELSCTRFLLARDASRRIA
jgi:hypothetical protein